MVLIQKVILSWHCSLKRQILTNTRCGNFFEDTVCSSILRAGLTLPGYHLTVDTEGTDQSAGV